MSDKKLLLTEEEIKILLLSLESMVIRGTRTQIRELERKIAAIEHKLGEAENQPIKAEG